VSRAGAVVVALAVGALLAASSSLAATALDTGAGLHRDVSFSDQDLVPANSDILKRMLSPLAYALAQASLARSGKTLSDTAIDLARERFVVYVPERAPPQGYGLLVFIPPWPEAKLPLGWAPVLDRFGIVYVSAAGSGNDANVFSRRAALALLALNTLRRHFHVDPDRTYIGGFSGGSRVALRMAMYFPDLFRGALLNAGSDPIGEPPDHFPTQSLFSQFQDHERVVMVTGAADSPRLTMDADSLRALRAACVSDVDARTTPLVGHEIAGGAALSQSLQALLDRPLLDGSRSAACKSALQERLAGEFERAETLIARADRAAARKALLALDASFGGLASPRTFELAKACRCGLAVDSSSEEQ
jgi:predicted esterase